MALSPAEMQEAIIKNLPKKTGKSLEEWIEIARDFKLTKNSEITKKLKADYGLGHGIHPIRINRVCNNFLVIITTGGVTVAFFPRCPTIGRDEKTTFAFRCFYNGINIFWVGRRNGKAYTT